ncbi:hypothetical protein BDN67DRAFT_528144 [Paxillus ammoniavirescens]|nr:hypothetical protein BDN67DRAFT_528144 [Paxillus ammoniavirescens]
MYMVGDLWLNVTCRDAQRQLHLCSSWASYNLVSACTVCVVQEQLASWKTWTTSCGSYVSTTTYLPSVLPASEGIPYFAGTDPATWTDEVFNVTEAAGKGGGTLADLTGAPSASPTTSSSSSKSSVGAIVGGVLGSIVVILVLVGLAFFTRAFRRRQASKGPFDGLTTTTVDGAHFFSVPTAPPQAPTGMVQPVSFPYPQGQNPTSHRPLSPYRSSHGHSAASVNITSLASPTSSAFTAPMSPPITDAADMISPFYATTRTENNRNRRTGKANEARAERALSPPASQRARLNPPPYSPTSPTPPPASPPPTRRLSLKQTFKRKGSTSGGTTHSAHSAASARGKPRAARMASAESVDSAASGGSVSTAGRGAGSGSQSPMTILERTNTSAFRLPAV